MPHDVFHAVARHSILNHYTTDTDYWAHVNGSTHGHDSGAHKRVNQCSKYLTEVQQQRPKSPMVTLNWFACKSKVHPRSRGTSFLLFFLYIFLDQISSENNGLRLFFNLFLSTGFDILLGVEEVDRRQPLALVCLDPRRRTGTLRFVSSFTSQLHVFTKATYLFT